MLTPRRKMAYIDGENTGCPHCGPDGNVEGGPVWIEGRLAMQECNCTECDKHWREVYQLVDVVEEE